VGSRWFYIFVIVKLPVPLQPVPLSVQVPVMVLPFAVPFMVRVAPDGVADCTLKPKLPFTLPLKLPLRVNDPVSELTVCKHGELELNLKLLMASEPSPFTMSEVPNVKMVVLAVSMSVAFHVPLMLPEFEFEPHPASVRPTMRRSAVAKYFMLFPRFSGFPKGALVQMLSSRAPVASATRYIG
jgi:hypothetical protein